MPFGPYWDALPFNTAAKRYVDAASWNAVIDNFINWKDNVNAGGHNLSNLGVLTFGASGYIGGALPFRGNVTLSVPTEVGRVSFGRTGSSPSAFIAGYSDDWGAVYSSGDLRMYTGPATGPVLRLLVDKNGNVGIGTASPAPAAKVHIVGPDGPLLALGHVSWPTKYYAAISGVVANGANETAGSMIFSTRRADGGPLTERVRIDDYGNVGVGGTPTVALEIWASSPRVHVNATNGTSNNYVRFLNTGSSTYLGQENSSGNSMTVGGLPYAAVFSTDSGRALQLGTANTARLTISPFGTVGIANTDPKARLHLGTGATFDNYSTVNTTDWGQNIYFDGQWRYLNSDAAVLTQMSGGAFHVYTAPVGTAGQQVSLVDRLAIAVTGELTISSTAAKPGGGTWSDTSDVRTKGEVRPFLDGLEVLAHLQPIRHTANGLGGTQAGFQGFSIVAQEARRYAPYCVRAEHRKLRPTDEQEAEVLTFDFTPLLYVLLNSVKQLNTRLKALEGRN